MKKKPKNAKIDAGYAQAKRIAEEFGWIVVPLAGYTHESASFYEGKDCDSRGNPIRIEMSGSACEALARHLDRQDRQDRGEHNLGNFYSLPKGEQEAILIRELKALRAQAVKVDFLRHALFGLSEYCSEVSAHMLTLRYMTVNAIRELTKEKAPSDI